jgi:hypothetical protein
VSASKLPTVAPFESCTSVKEGQAATAMAREMIPNDPDDMESVEEHRRALDEALDGGDA